MSKFDHSDTGNADLLNYLFGDNIRHDPQTDRWLSWKDSQHRWQELTPVETTELAINTANYRLMNSTKMPDTDAIKAEALFAIRSRNLRMIENMLALAKNRRPIGGHNILWDKEPKLLAVSNGVIDLTTSQFQSGSRSHYLSTGLNLPYIPGSGCPRWERFIQEICCGDTELASFIQRAIGYTLTGYTREQVFFLLYGTGGNGKSVLVDTLGHLLSGFSKTIRFSAFDESGTTDAKRDLAELPGVRATFASEGAELKGLDTATIKMITGGEEITTSKKYGHPFSFRPQFKLWLSTNHLPRIDDDSYGFWRRVILIPFNAVFEGSKRENNLAERLQDELPGILVWAVAGAKLWYERGLETPDSLLLRIQQYRTSEDEIENFVRDCCKVDPNLKEKSSTLYSTYTTWKHERGERPNNTTIFGRRLSVKFSKHHEFDGWYYDGLGLSQRIRV